MIANLWNDLRYAARALSRSPGFTMAAIVTIGLGVGINAGIFTVLNGLLFRDLPAPDARRLVAIEQTVDGGEFTGTNGPGRFTIAEYYRYRDGTETLSGLAAHADPRETTLGGAAPQKIYGAIVSCNYFDVLAEPPAMGRALSARDCAPGAEPVVVLGHELWTSAFDADPAILGRTIELERYLFTVVGVAAEGTYGGSPLRTGYFAPLGSEPLLYPGASRFEDERFLWLYQVGRRAEGASLDRVRAELRVIAARIDREEPGRSTTLTVERATPTTIPSDLRGLIAGAAAVLMAAFGAVLLIACANVANLLLARGAARSREIAIRLSLGASRARVVRQLLAECTLISIAGGLLGSALALWSFETLVALVLPRVLPPEIPGIVLELDFSPDYRVLAFALTLTLATGVLFGLAPALLLSKPDLNTVIKQDLGNAAGGRRGGRLRATLIGAQVAFSMVLMIATGLLLRGLQTTYTIDPGFAYDNVVHVSFGTDGGPDIRDRALLDEIAALPGVESAAYATQTPLGEARTGIAVRLPGRGADEALITERDRVTPGYFSLLEIAIVRGRGFTEADSEAVEGETPVRPIIVSETTARNFWGDADPIGRTLLLAEPRRALAGGLVDAPGVTLQVVGVSADARLGALGSVDPYYIFEPRREGGELLVKIRADRAATTASIRAAVQARAPAVPFRILPLEGNLAWWRGISGMVTTLGAGLGLLALVLATVGIYGVVAYAVARRYPELGIRMALGAKARDVLGLILRQTMRPVIIGAALGIAAAVAVSGVLSSVLFGVSPSDALGFGGATLLVLGIALAAGVLAARPATRVDPAETLRHE